MASSPSVVGCSTCGALYTPSLGDGRVCDACRITVADDPAGGAVATPLFGEPNSGSAPRQRSSASPHRLRALRRFLRRAVFALIAVGLIAGGAAAVASKRQALAGAWTSIARHSPAQMWTALRRRAAEAWVAVRSRIPLGTPQDEATSRADAPSTQTAHRRAQHPGKGKRNRERAIASQ